jgi:hypothetical protein
LLARLVKKSWELTAINSIYVQNLAILRGPSQAADAGRDEQGFEGLKVQTCIRFAVPFALSIGGIEEG